MTKLYNIGAYGIPARFLWHVNSWSLDLRWSRHAQEEANGLVRHLGFSAFAFPSKFTSRDQWVPSRDQWEVVELEATEAGCITKIVARRPVEGTKWSLVLVINPDGVVRTCWANLISDNHRTLDISKYAKS